MRRSLLLTAMLCLAWGGAAGARAEGPATGTLTLKSGWSLEPILLKDTIVGYYGELSKDKAVGQNVTRLWLHSTPEGTWAMYGWSESSADEAIAAIRSYYGPASLSPRLAPTSTQLAECPAQQAVALRPKVMPAGFLPSDPYAEGAGTLSAETVTKLVADGAAGAPELSALQHTTATCSPSLTTQLDAQLDAATARFDELLGSKSATAKARAGNKCSICLPGTYDVWGPWSAWACTGGPTLIHGCGTGACQYSGCTQTRTGTAVSVGLFCGTTIVGPISETNGPQNVTIALPASGTCPAHP